MKGWIALDIDGTITLDKYSVPKEVTQELRKLVQSGWNLALATGRPFAFAKMALSDFDFPYWFLVQNGSAVLEMPEEKLVFKNYIDPQELQKVEEAYRGIDTDFVIYSGCEKGDFCYWRPDRMSEEDLHYLHDLQMRQKEAWRAVGDFDAEKLEPFPLIKCFGIPERMEIVADRLKADFETTLIRDPFVESFKIILVTAKGVSKGNSLEEVFRLKGRGSLVVAAGDDKNDISLFKAADVKIAMPHAPQSLLELATLIAPPTKERGIIQALRLALRDYDY